MNRGLVEKTLREVWAWTLAFGCAAMVVEALLAYALPTFQQEISGAWFRIGFVREMFKALLGMDIADPVGPAVFTAIAWVHPLFLAILWAHQIAFAARMPAGEVERGTIDVLLGQPVSRMEVYVHESAVWLVSGAAIVGMALAGNLAGSHAVRGDVFPRAGSLVPLLCNLFCLNVAVGGIAYLISTLCNNRGKAIGWAFGVAVWSLLIAFLAQVWEAAGTVSFLSLMNYFRPGEILRDGRWPLADMAVLAAVAAVAWTAGAVVFRRRDILTV
jgi:ABC-type transport system involved in multi-copper enzyme maturation permease subunit